MPVTTVLALTLPLLAPWQTPSGDTAGVEVALRGSFGGGPEQVHSGSDDGFHWLRGPSYKAFADGEGFRFLPFLGSRAERNHPVTFEVTGLRVDGRPRPLRRPEARRAGRTLVLDHGAVEVSYEGRLDGVEQSFLVERPAEGWGEVALEVRLSSDMEAVPDGRGVRLEGAEGCVHIGAAVALDGAGGRCALPCALSSDRITYRVPAAFAQGAGERLLIDPLISTGIVAGLSVDLSEPDVAYDASRDVYSVVYTGAFSGTDRDVHSTTLDGSTLAVLDAGFVDVSADDTFRPRVGCLAGEDAFVVAYARTGAFGIREIHARSRDASSGAPWGSPRVVAGSTEFDEPLDHDVGGEAYEGPGCRAIVTWEVSPLGGAPFKSGIRARLLDATAAPVTGYIEIVQAFGARDHGAPAVSKYSGDPGQHSAWWIAYPADSTVGVHRTVRAARLTYQGTVTQPDEAVCSLPANIRSVDVSAPYVGVDEPEVVHFLATDDLASFDVHVATRTPSEVGSFGAVRSVRDVAGYDGDMRVFEGSLATLPDRAALAYGHFDYLPASSPILIHGTTIERERAGFEAIGEQPARVALVQGGFWRGMSMTSEFAGGASSTSRRVLGVWHDIDWDPNDRIAYSLMDFHALTSIGRRFCTGNRNSLGHIASIVCSGHPAPWTPKFLHASYLPQQTFGMYLVSRSFGSTSLPGSEGRLCLLGQIGRLNGSLGSSGSTGTISYLFDPRLIPQGAGTVAAVTGETWGVQLWYRDVTTGPTSNLTTGLAITF